MLLRLTIVNGTPAKHGEGQVGIFRVRSQLVDARMSQTTMMLRAVALVSSMNSPEGHRRG